jgi:hypothetical protein
MASLASRAPLAQADAALTGRWLALFPASTLLHQLWFFRRGLPAGFSRLASRLVAIAQLIALGLLLTAALGHAGPREFGFYSSAILLALFNASVLFVRLLATSFRRDEPAA